MFRGYFKKSCLNLLKQDPAMSQLSFFGHSLRNEGREKPNNEEFILLPSGEYLLVLVCLISASLTWVGLYPPFLSVIRKSKNQIGVPISPNGE